MAYTAVRIVNVRGGDTLISDDRDAIIKPAAPITAAYDVVVRLLGPVTRLRRLTEGMESLAFAYRRGREDFVLRVNADHEGFEKDRLAHDRFTSAEIPIPEVIEVGPFDAGHAYCISRLIPGVTLQDLALDALAAVLTPTADVLAAIVAADLTGTSGYGPWDSTGHARYGSWRKFVLDIPEPGEGMDPVLADRLRSYVGEIRLYADAYPEERRLIHGDFGSNNVLSDGRDITGVIDWSESMYGDPLYDVANVFVWRSWLPCMEAQARYFEKTAILTANTRDRIRCYALRIGVLELMETSSADVVRWATRRCDQLLAGRL